MAKNELKTKLNDGDVDAFIDAVKDPQKREDAKKLLKIFEKVTGYKGKMWGSSIIGFGSYHYKYATGREGDWPVAGFSPRAQNMTVYIMAGFDEYAEFSGYDPKPILEKLGKFSTGKSCLYFKRLSDLNEDALRRLIKESVHQLEKRDKANR